MRRYFAYVRVSTQRQGEYGSSLQEQRSAIEAFAKREHLTISDWFEERETAAKQGRTVFRRMFTILDKGNAHGVIMHKIDRGARNLSDWSDLAKLLDKGIEVRFANDNLDMQTRGGRLAADIQAVVAADYIRNLREEVIKGMYGRLKQGYYPLKAPIGYLDNGSAQPKTICPRTGPYVKQIFNLYGTGNYSLRTLGDELTRRGIRGQRGKPLGVSRLSAILNNPFYHGIIRIKRNGQTFVGNHEPIVSKALFERVQAIKRKQIKLKTGVRHAYILQRMLRCRTGSHSLYAEKHKGRIYYRCQARGCFSGSVREDRVLTRIAGAFRTTRVRDEMLLLMNEALPMLREDDNAEQHQMHRSLSLRRAQLNDREKRLTEVYLEHTIDENDFNDRWVGLHIERTNLDEALTDLERHLNVVESDAAVLFKTLEQLDIHENSSELRALCRGMISQMVGDKGSVAIVWHHPFSQLLSGVSNSSS